MRPLRVAVTVDPYIPVPPRLYGGIERVVDFLVRGLTARGHRVTLLAHPESHGPGELVPYGVPPHVGAQEAPASTNASTTSRCPESAAAGFRACT